MSLRNAKGIYCLAVIAIALILDCTGGMIGWATAVLLLAGALPMFEAVSQAISDTVARAIIADAETHCQNRPDDGALPQ